MSAVKILFWDIDGTLLTTARAGIFAWERAVEDIVGGKPCFAEMKTAGLTDVAIAEAILTKINGAAAPELVKRLVTAYEDYLPQSLPRRRGRVLAGVEAVLRRAEESDEYESILLTGNTQRGANAKLEHYNLSRYFRIGSFSGERSDRVSIAKHAVSLVNQEIGDVRPDRMFVIGDTPHDVQCGKAIGARTIAVATGIYSIDELQACEPWRALPEIGEAESFLSILDVARVNAAQFSTPGL